MVRVRVRASAAMWVAYEGCHETPHPATPATPASNTPCPKISDIPTDKLV